MISNVENFDTSPSRGRVITRVPHVKLLKLAVLRQVYTFTEQPSNSWMFKTPWFLAFIRWTVTYFGANYLVRHFIRLGAYGGPSPKPTHVYSTLPTFSMVNRKKVPEGAALERLTYEDEFGRTHGRKEAMKLRGRNCSIFIFSAAKPRSRHRAHA